MPVSLVSLRPTGIRRPGVLLRRRFVRSKLGTSRRKFAGLKDICQDVGSLFRHQFSGIVLRHRVANLAEQLRQRLLCEITDELVSRQGRAETAFEHFTVTQRALSLVNGLATSRLIFCIYALHHCLWLLRLYRKQNGTNRNNR